MSTLTRRESWSNLSRATTAPAPAPEAAQIPSSPSKDEKRVAPIYTYSPKTTSINFPWPKELTGLERIALSAKGDLQRVLSAFFARPITIATIYSNTYYHPKIHEPSVPLVLPNTAAIDAASRESPIVQKRQVHLQCSSKVVCVATSTVRITSPTVANLFLVEKYAIGQMFSRMDKVPEFELLSVGLGPVTDDAPNPASPLRPSRVRSEKTSSDEDEQLWRKYRLFVEDFECDILEVFPTREMFDRGLHWLEDAHGWATEQVNHRDGIAGFHLPLTSRRQTIMMMFLSFGFLLMLVYELSVYLSGRSLFCPS
ncbi:hypothetical protein H0H93_006047 [Arthromyces matolae]|nr:hypothetical protein H0H93_006047 [Arthromyces matolae]